MRLVFDLGSICAISVLLVFDFWSNQFDWVRFVVEWVWFVHLCSIFGRFLLESVLLSSVCGRVSSIEFDLCICVRFLVDCCSNQFDWVRFVVEWDRFVHLCSSFGRFLSIQSDCAADSLLTRWVDSTQSDSKFCPEFCPEQNKRGVVGLSRTKSDNVSGGQVVRRLLVRGQLIQSGKQTRLFLN